MTRRIILLLYSKDNFKMRGFKKEKIHGDMKMSDLILSNHLQVLVLERFGIELGVQDKTIATVCNEYNISAEVFLTIANLQNNSAHFPDLSLSNSDIEEIIKYLKRSHQYFSEEVFPEIITNIHRMSEFNNKPEIVMVEEFFNEYKNEVDQHFNYENVEVFPYILSLLEPDKTAGVSQYSVSEYKEHHDDIEDKLDDLKKLLIQHLPQKKDCVIRRKILFALFNLELDLAIHTKIENDILIPLVEKIEILNHKN